jgi:hypothetical protein
MPPPVPPQRTDARDQAPQERRDEGDADRDEAHEIEDACQSASDEPRERQVEQGGEEAATDVVEVADQPWNPRVVDTGDAGPGCRVARHLLCGTFRQRRQCGLGHRRILPARAGGPRVALRPTRDATKRPRDPSRPWLHYQYDVSRSRPRWSRSTARIAGEVLMDDYSGGSAAAAAAALIVFAFFIFIFAVIGYVISAFFLMKIFDKAGVRASGAPGCRSTTSWCSPSSATSARGSCWAPSGVRCAEPGPGSRVDHRAAPGRCGCTGRVASGPEAAKRPLGHPLCAARPGLARHPRLRQVALEHERAARAVGGERLPRRSHRLAGRSRPDVGSARRLHASGGLPASGASGELPAAGASGRIPAARAAAATEPPAATESPTTEPPSAPEPPRS